MKKTTSLSEANRECQSVIPVTQPTALPITKGHLASIRDETENTFVAGLIEANSNAWLGGGSDQAGLTGPSGPSATGYRTCDIRIGKRTV